MQAVCSTTSSQGGFCCCCDDQNKDPSAAGAVVVVGRCLQYQDTMEADQDEKDNYLYKNHVFPASPRSVARVIEKLPRQANQEDNDKGQVKQRQEEEAEKSNCYGMIPTATTTNSPTTTTATTAPSFEKLKSLAFSVAEEQWGQQHPQRPPRIIRVHERELLRMEQLCRQQQCANTTSSSSLSVPSFSSKHTNDKGGKQDAVGVLIHAESGLGKSALMDRFAALHQNKNQVDDEDDEYLFMTCKFEERATAASEPFQALQHAVQQLLHQLWHQRSIWRKRLLRAIAGDLHIFISILPCIKPFLSLRDHDHDHDHDDDHDDKNSPQQPQRHEEPSTSSRSIKDTFFFSAKDPISQGDGMELRSVDSMESISFDAFGDMASKEWRFERFRVAFRSMIRCICDNHHDDDGDNDSDPRSSSSKGNEGRRHRNRKRLLVLQMDDLHWAEADSLAILKTLLEDKRRPGNFFFLGASRPLEECPHLRHFCQQIRPSTRLELLHLRPLTSSEVQDMLRTLLFPNHDKDHGDHGEGDDDNNKSKETNTTSKKATADLEALRDIVEQKTGGNTFVILQWIRLLERKQCMSYSQETQSWEWNVDRITTEMASTTTSALSDQQHAEQLVAESLQCMASDETKSALIVAASFGASHFAAATVVHAIPALEAVHRDDVHEVYDDPCTVQQKIREIQSHLQKAVQAGFLEEVKPGQFRFTHDRIRHAAYQLLPQEGEARKKLHLRIGRQLRTWMDMEAELGLLPGGLTEDATLLHAAKQLNSGAELITDEWELFDVAELNFRAAELAAKKSSFSQSVEYLEMGLRQLGPDRWNRHYTLTLKLTVALCRMQYCLGLCDPCLASTDEVLSHARDFADKRPVYHTKVLCLCQHERYLEAREQLLDIFAMLGEPFPKRLFMPHLMIQFSRVDSRMKQLTDEEILNFDDDQDEAIQTSSDFVQRLSTVCLLVSNQESVFYSLLASLRMIKTVLERKGSPALAHAIANWAVFMAFFCRFDEAVRFAKVSLELAKRVRDRQPGFSLRIAVSYWVFIHHWQNPAREAVEPLTEICNKLWALGCLEFAHMDRCFLLRHRFLCGERLDDVYSECQRISESLLDFKQQVHWNSFAPMFQAVQNLTTTSSLSPSRLSGDFMREEIDLPVWKERCGHQTAVVHYQYFVMVLSYHFQDFDRAKSVMKEMSPDPFDNGPFFLVPQRLLYRGLVYFALARKYRKWKYQRRGRYSMKKLQEWYQKGAVNCAYMYKLLHAEDLSLSRKSIDVVLDAYDDVISEARRLVMRPHIALGNELAGAFLLGRSQTAMARSYTLKALDAYRDWGAITKVKALESHHKALLVEKLE